MTDTYKTIPSAAEGIFKDKGSRFLSFALPVRQAEEVKEIVKAYRKEYYDARHVCYAYMLGAERKEFRANDDGEPSGTAGRPILGQINSKELTDVLVIVVRYFGGTLLGTSGLIHAYKEASSDALTRAGVIEKMVKSTFVVHFEYPLMNEVMRIAKDTAAEIMEQFYDNDCCIKLSIRRRDAELLKNRLGKIEGVRISSASKPA